MEQDVILKYGTGWFLRTRLLCHTAIPTGMGWKRTVLNHHFIVWNAMLVKNSVALQTNSGQSNCNNIGTVLLYANSSPEPYTENNI